MDRPSPTEFKPLKFDIYETQTNYSSLYKKYSDYIQTRAPVYISHSAGRFAIKRFRKANCPIIERLTNSLMMNGRNNGKKLMAVRIVAHSFEIVRTTNFSSTILMFPYSTPTPTSSPSITLQGSPTNPFHLLPNRST